jgi:hypothetical protein
MDQRNPIIGARITDNCIAVGNANRIVAVVYSIWSGPAQTAKERTTFARNEFFAYVY